MLPDFSKITNSIIPISCKIVGWVNIYDARLGENCKVGPFVEIGGAVIGDRTVISSGAYLCPHLEIGSDCFIGHNVAFVNDTFETPENYDNIEQMRTAWTPRRTVIGNSVRIGSGAVIMPVRIHDHAVIGAGAIVTHDVAAGAIVAGNPARVMKRK